MIDKIKLIVCQDCPSKKQPTMMRDEKEIRQMAQFIYENDIKVDLVYFSDWIFYKNDNLETYIDIWKRSN